jgi:hypothetical protein
VERRWASCGEKMKNPTFTNEKKLEFSFHSVVLRNHTIEKVKKIWVKIEKKN